METLKNILGLVVVSGGLGGLIDFLIGKAGREKAKDFLLKWWLRFDDVRWNNFGREEGLFAKHIIERWFGRHLWSYRRLVTGLLLYIIFLLVGYFKTRLHGAGGVSCYSCRFGIVYTLISLIVLLVGYSISVTAHPNRIKAA
jgi:hypothetical protein